MICNTMVTFAPKNDFHTQKVRRILLPLVAGLGGALLLTSLYFGIVSWAESMEHALEFFWQDRWIVFPIVLGFGVQSALYVILRMHLYIPVNIGHHSGILTSASGMTSTVAMVACCAHHVTDVLPVLGLTVVAAFLAEYRTVFMLVGLGTTLVGISVMLLIIFRDRQKVLSLVSLPGPTEAS